MPGLTLRVWGDQAAAVTKTLDKSHYRSVATQAEVKLREALDRCNELVGSHLVASDRPQKPRTAVCCKLLSELCPMAGPFRNILQTLCQELVRPE